MNIAICEDNIEIIGLLEKIVFECFGNNTVLFTCDSFMSGEELLENIEQSQIAYQIYILDIEMRKINGLDVAAFIRKTDQKALIVFVTNHSELMQEAFEVMAFHYLIKPIDELKTKQVILRAIEAVKIKKNTFHYAVRKKIFTLYFDQIEYFESNKRKIIIHTATEEYEYYGTIRDISKQLDPRTFVQIHNSYIVNMDYIKFVDALNVILISDIKITITKKYYKEFNTKYRNYVLKRML